MTGPETPGSESPETPAAPPTDAAPPAPAPAASQTPYQAASRPSRLGYLSFFGGLTMLVCGLVWNAVEKESSVVTNVWIFLSLLAMLVPPAWHSVEIGRAVASRRGAAFGFVVLTLGLGLVVAGFVGWADVHFKASLPSLDLTKSSRYSLSDESAKLLEKVDGTVYATYIAQGGSDPGLREKTMEQLRTFESASSHVRVAEVDAFRNPDAAERTLKEQGVSHATSSGEDTDLLVLTYAEPGKEVAPGKQKEIKIEPWTFSKMSATEERKWLGEGVIAAGIYELVFQKYRAYATGGHGERVLAKDFHALRDVLTSQNVDVESEPLVLAAKPQIPDDCEILIVLAPTAPFTSDEAALVSRWIDTGKTLFLCVDVQNDRASTGLDALLDRFGVHTRSNYEVYAPQLQRMTVNNKEVLVGNSMGPVFAVQGPAYAEHPATRALRARSGLATFFFHPTYLDIDPKPPEGADPQVVCSAPEAQGQQAIGMRHDPTRKDYSTPDEKFDVTGIPMPLVATSTRKGRDGDARLVISGDADVFSDRVIDEHAPNLDLARGLVQWGLRREGLVAVSDKTLEDPFVTPTEYQRRFALGWPAFVCLLPLIAGLMVWWARRR